MNIENAGMTHSPSENSDMSAEDQYIRNLVAIYHGALLELNAKLTVQEMIAKKLSPETRVAMATCQSAELATPHLFLKTDDRNVAGSKT